MNEPKKNRDKQQAELDQEQAMLDLDQAAMSQDQQQLDIEQADDDTGQAQAERARKVVAEETGGLAHEQRARLRKQGVHAEETIQRRTQAGVDRMQDRHDLNQATQDSTNDETVETEVERKAMGIRNSAEETRQGARYDRKETQAALDETRRLREAARKSRDDS